MGSSGRNGSTTGSALPLAPTRVKIYIPLNRDERHLRLHRYKALCLAAWPECPPNRERNLWRLLSMWLKFEPVAPLPLATASLKFTFWDLDLANINDPLGFFETFQLFASNGTALSQVFTHAAGSGDADGKTSGYLDVNPSLSVTERINWTLTRSLGSAGVEPINLSLWCAWADRKPILLSRLRLA